MKIYTAIKTVIYSILLGWASLCASEVEIGPFEFKLDQSEIRVGKPVERSDYVPFQQSPVCVAIRNKKLLEVIVEAQMEDGRSVLKRIVVEPYAFGYDREGALVLTGYRRKEVTLEDPYIDTFTVSFRYNGKNKPAYRYEIAESDEMYTNKQRYPDESRGIFRIFHRGQERWKTFLVTRIVDARVLENSSFEPRKQEKLQNIVNPICEVEMQKRRP
ncbi:MAG: hypothetical protein Tsb0021_07370 [Chlamydiales bacterium]